MPMYGDISLYARGELNTDKIFDLLPSHAAMEESIERAVREESKENAGMIHRFSK